MADFADELIEESKRIRAQGQRIRGQAISSQIKAGLTLCSAAGESIRRGNLVNAKKTLDALARSIQTIRRHLGESEHVPAGVLPTLCAELEQLEKQLKTIQEELHR